MRYKDIAVIGMSGRFAKSNNIDEYRELMKEKACVIDVPTKERIELMQYDTNAEYMKCGYINDVSGFDNDFFDISKREARLMSPEQRISLEMVADAIWDAGYSLEDFRGSNCGVYVAGGESEYNNFNDKQSSASIIGSQSFMLSGRIGYHFDLEGENVSINSGCSSALAAIHYACEKINLGEVDTAIVGGIMLYVDVPKAKDNMYDILGIISESYTLKAFDEKANGTVCGEGGGYIVIKDLEQAKKDKDHIYGVILSGATNGDGGRCTNVSMPSVEAQGEVVLKAWKDIEVEKITEIEAHGIGAPIGDAVEIQGVIDVLKKRNIAEQPIIVSTVKPNVGHLFAQSGIASMIKVLTGYKYGESYPIASLENVNPLINFEETGLKPLKDVYHWEKTAERITGISSFGLSGCNTHIVVKNYIDEIRNEEPTSLLKISAKTETAFNTIKKNLLKYLSTQEYSLGDLVYTLNIGRDDYQYRSIIPVRNITDLKNSLETVQPVKTRELEDKVFFVMKAEQTENSYEEQFGKVLPLLSDKKNQFTQNLDVDFKMALYRSLLEIGIKNSTLLVDKIFGTAIQLSEGKSSVDDLNRVIKETDIHSDYEKYVTQVRSKNKVKKKIIIVDFTKEHGMSQLEKEDNIEVFYVQKPSEIERLIKYWYETGGKINWKKYYGNSTYHRISAPGYPFAKNHFWIDMKSKVTQVNNTQAEIAQPISVPVNTSPRMESVERVKLPEKKIFVLKSEEIDEIDISTYPYADTAFKKVFYPETSNIDTDYKLAMYRYVTGQGIMPDVILADKRGKAVISFSKGRIGTKRLRRTSSVQEYNKNYENVITMIENYAKGFAVTVFDFGHNTLLKEYSWNGNVRVVSLSEEGALKEYIQNPDPQYYEVKSSRVETEQIKSTMIDKPEITMSQNEKNSINNSTTQKSNELIEAENFLEKIWLKAFNLEGAIGHDEDFFALGGNSLIMQSMSDEINQYFKKKFDIFEIYDYETIEKLAVKILGD